MNWYTAECSFRSVLRGKPAKSTQLLEHRYFLLKAADDKSAKTNALELAKKKQHSYLNADGTKVEWVLEKVIDVKEIVDKELSEGTEVFHKYSNRRVKKAKK
jgi:hypothetical protein